ncbi:hypothetical protein E4U55_002762 [Claviceps digitariae]|nr:hypothetical protein E4U55_002762 [Claviceps digitariae]
MLSKGRPLDTFSSLLSPSPSLLLPDHNSDRNLAWETQSTRADISARTRAYPSPPMSGTPSVSPNDYLDLYRQSRGSSTYSSDGVKDVYSQKRPFDVRHLPPPQVSMPPASLASFAGSYQGRPTMERSYTYLAPDAHSNRSSPFSVHDPQHEIRHGQNSSQFASAAAAAAAAAATSSRTRAELSHSCASTSAGSQVVNSPKIQRKTKGHVASACVPCKRAHLRCDAQRPCIRCVGTGKEESCVDVQHKKRGRPRLRDDRDARFENARQTVGHSREMSPRRPVDIHPSGVPGTFDEYYQHHQQFRPADIGASASGFSAVRPDGPGPGCHPNGYHTPVSLSPVPPEPVAYLNMNLEFIKGSASFWDTLGLQNMTGRNLGDIVMPAEFQKVAAIHSYFNNEQRRREPNYLPPILGRASQSIHGLGFDMEDFGHFQLPLQDHLAFSGSAGAYPKTLPIRAGLAKEGSCYFIVLLLNLNLPARQIPRQQYMPPSVAERQGGQAELPYSRISPGALSAQRGPTVPVPGPVDPVHVGRGETAAVTHAPNHREHSSVGQSSRALNAREYGFDHAHAARPLSDRPLSASIPSRAIWKELTPPKPSHTPPSTVQLPPIRPQLDRPAPPGAPTRDAGYGERPNRLAIGGLLGNPDEPFRPDDNGRR